MVHPARCRFRPAEADGQSLNAGGNTHDDDRKYRFFGGRDPGDCRDFNGTVYFALETSFAASTKMTGVMDLNLTHSAVILLQPLN
ncbi:MAG: hypothetical protein AB1512_30580, partial [Thermodesulfobacteriota bacterium]